MSLKTGSLFRFSRSPYGQTRPGSQRGRSLGLAGLLLLAGPVAQARGQKRVVPAPGLAKLTFGEAVTAAHAATGPISLYLRLYVAETEIADFPASAVPELKAVVRESEDLEADQADAGAVRRVRAVRSVVAENAVRDLVRLKRWDDAEQLARGFDGADAAGIKGELYGLIAAGLVESGRGGQAPALLRECMRTGAEFPYVGGGEVVADSHVPEEDRLEVVAMGLAAAEESTAPDRSLPEFLAAALASLPAAASRIEATSLDVLARLAARPKLSIYDLQTGGLLLTLVRKIDVTRAAAEQARYPQFGFVPEPPPSRAVVQSGAASYQLGPPEGLTDRLAEQAGKDPAAALAAANGLSSESERFAGLVAVARSLANVHREQAARAANSAYELADKDLIAAQLGWSEALADVLNQLGDTGHATDLNQQCLDIAAARLNDLGDQYADLAPEELADRWQAIRVAVVIYAYLYRQAGSVAPRAAIASAKTIRFPALGAIALANAAQGAAAAEGIAALPKDINP